MKIETILARLESAKKTLEKKEGTLARHQKTLQKKTEKAMKLGFTSYQEAWEHRLESQKNMDACWAWAEIQDVEDDIERTEEDIQKAKENVAKWEAMLQQEQEKANSRNVKPIMEFLEAWKEMNISFFIEQKKLFDIAEVEHETERKVLEHKMYNASTKEERTEARKERSELYFRFKQKWSHVGQFFMGSDDWETNMKKALEDEKNRKYDDMVERVSRVVGEIKDASYLSVNEKGNLDGFIIGTKGKAHVYTIGAGGYNIQCFHFRTLINKVK